MLEINGTNVATKSHRETNKLLLHHHQQGAVMKIVVARPPDSLSPDNTLAPPDEDTTSIEHYQKLNTSLNAKLEFQSAEVDHWKQECERYVYTAGFESELLYILYPHIPIPSDSRMKL